MSTKSRAQQVILAFWDSHQQERSYWHRDGVAAALREAVEGLNIEPDPDRELSIEKHHFIRGQNWVKDAIMRLADEISAKNLY